MNILPPEILIKVCIYVNDPGLIKNIFGYEYFNMCRLHKIKASINNKSIIKDDDHIPYRDYYEQNILLLKAITGKGINASIWNDPELCKDIIEYILT